MAESLQRAINRGQSDLTPAAKQEDMDFLSREEPIRCLDGIKNLLALTCDTARSLPSRGGRRSSARTGAGVVEHLLRIGA